MPLFLFYSHTIGAKYHYADATSLRRCNIESLKGTYNMLNNLPNFKNLMSIDTARDMFESVNKLSNEYFTSIYELNVKLTQDAWNLWSKKNDKLSND